MLLHKSISLLATERDQETIAEKGIYACFLTKSAVRLAWEVRIQVEPRVGRPHEAPTTSSERESTDEGGLGGLVGVDGGESSGDINMERLRLRNNKVGGGKG